MKNHSFFTAPSPQALGQQMMPLDAIANNPGSMPSSQGGGMDMGALAKMMSRQQGLSNVAGMPQGVPANATSWGNGAGPLPWLPQNALPWSGS